MILFKSQELNTKKENFFCFLFNHFISYTLENCSNVKIIINKRVFFPRL